MYPVPAVPGAAARLARIALFLALPTLAGCDAGPHGAAGSPARALPVRAALPPGVGPWHEPAGLLAVDDAVPVGGGWALLDGRSALLHLWDPDRGDLETVGGAGDGPGELRAPRLLAGDADGVWVVAADGRLDRFDATGSFVERAAFSVEGCTLPELREAAVLDGRLFLAATCRLDRTRRFLLVAVEPSGRGRILRARDAGEGGTLSLHGPSVGAAGGRLAFGTGEDRCLELLEPDGDAAGQACLAGPPLALPDSLRRELEASVGRRARGVGMRLALPELFPWHDRILGDADGSPVVRRPVSAAGWALERAAPRPGRWPLPPGVEVHGAGGRLLLVHHGMEGVSLAPVAPGLLPWTDAPPGGPPVSAR